MYHDDEQLDTQVKEIEKLLDTIRDEDYWQNLRQNWRRPGWTTPAERLLVAGHLNALKGSLEHIRQHQEMLLAGCRAVGEKG